MHWTSTACIALLGASLATYVAQTMSSAPSDMPGDPWAAAGKKFARCMTDRLVSRDAKAVRKALALAHIEPAMKSVANRLLEEAAERLAIACGADRRVWQQRTQNPPPPVLFTEYGSEVVIYWNAMKQFQSELRNGEEPDDDDH